MRLLEKLLLLFSVLIICEGAICLVWNQDIYKSVEIAHPAKGYAEFVTKLTDSEFIMDNYAQWEDSNSWVLNGLYAYLTTDGATLNTFSLLFTQAVITFAFYYSFACIPFIILMIMRMYQNKRILREEPHE